MSELDKKIQIYLAHATADTAQLHSRLQIILARAGLDVVLPSLKDNLSAFLAVNGSIHLIGNKTDNDTESLIEADFSQAQQRYQNDRNFNIFVWHPHDLLPENHEHNKLLNQVRNSIYSNMIFSTHDSPVLFVEDIRNLLLAEQNVEFDTKLADVFFIYNTIDYATAREMVDLLSDITGVEELKIDPNGRANYSDFITHQVNKSKLTVVYYDRASDWALPFLQQVWKNSGGASVRGHFLLIGGKENNQKMPISFDAPKTSVKMVALEMIPLEIKVELDRLQNYE